MITFFIRLALRLLKAALALILVLALAWFFREPLLRCAAHAWIVDAPASHADAIIVLGGGRDWRPFAAAELYLRGVSPLALVSQPKSSPSESLLALPSDPEVNIDVLLKKGVPTSGIQRFGENVTSTRDEALALRDWCQSHKVSVIIIPTDPFHTRRARWIFERALEGTGVEVRVHSVQHPVYSAENWWQHEEGLLAFQNEILKSLYYLFHY